MTKIAIGQYARKGTGSKLPAELCGYTADADVCIAAAWHDGEHKMIPRRWLVRSGEASQEVLDEIRAYRAGPRHQHVWGPFGCWCGASRRPRRETFEAWARRVAIPRLRASR